MEYIIISITLFIAVVYMFRAASSDIFSPVVLALFMMILFYIFDYIFILFDSNVRYGYWLSGTYFSYDKSFFFETSIIIFFSVIFWIIGDAMATRAKSKKAHFSKFIYSESGVVSYSGYIFTLIFVIFSGMVLIRQISSTVGLSVYLNDMASRSIVFEMFTIQNAIIHFSVLLGGLISSHYTMIQRREISGFLLLTVCLLIAFITGGRAIVLMILLSYAYMYNYTVSKINLNFRLILFVLLLILGLPFVALLTRTSSEFYDDAILANIFNTGQIPQANNLLLLTSNELGGALNGSSFVHDLFSFVPSFIFNFFGIEKHQGGNTDFTIIFWPFRWDTFKSQVSLGGIGEMYFNFHLIGVVVISCFLGFSYKWLYIELPRLIKRNNIGLYLILPLYWSIFQQFRGDYFHTINKLFIFSMVIIVFTTFLMKRKIK